jgi:uncharacterized repeat protein (TIGR01451 family)
MARRWSFWMTPLEHRSIRWLDDQYRGLLTPMGQVLLWTIVSATMLQIADGSTLKYGGKAPLLVMTIAFASGSFIAGILLGIPFRPRVSLRRVMPPPPTAGDTLTYRVVVENTGRRPARNIVIQERGLPAEVRPIGDAPTIELLLPGESAEVTLTLSCQSRGAFALSRLQAASTFPSAVWKYARASRHEDRLLVYPKLLSVERLNIPLGRHYQPGGVASASQVGESTEFLGTRDWRHGDRLRDLHWPSFARTGRPVVKEFQEEYFVRVALVIDTEAQSAKDEQALEKGISFAASAAHALAREDAIIDLFAAGSDVFRFTAGRALAHVEQIMEILSCIQPEDELNIQAAEAMLLPEAGQLSAVLFVIVQWDEKRARLVHAMRDRGVAVRVLILRPTKLETGLTTEELLVLP